MDGSTYVILRQPLVCFNDVSPGPANDHQSRARFPGLPRFLAAMNLRLGLNRGIQT